MSNLHAAELERALDALPRLYPGPGGTAGVVSEGKVIATRAWGYADLARHRPMKLTPDCRYARSPSSSPAAFCWPGLHNPIISTRAWRGFCPDSGKLCRP
jgi:CubicO group peptidase (beta-lactamase class C family)